MSKQRVGNPAEQAVPWGQSGNPVLPQFSEEGQGNVTPEKADASEPFPEQPNVDSEPETNAGVVIPQPGEGPNVVANSWKPEPRQTSPFAEPKAKSPFAPKPKPVVVSETKVFPLGENDPSWLQLVQFCQKHGDKIIQARYPHPRGECIDTIYRGVTVFPYKTTQVRHSQLGWIDWQDAIYE